MQPTASIPAPFVRSSPLIGRRFALLWLIVALLFQGLAIQAHAHPGAGSYASATASMRSIDAAAVDGQKKAPVAPACPLCEEKALFGAYLLSGSATIAPPVDAAYVYVAASLRLLALRASSHAWHSRAPPLFTI